MRSEEPEWTTPGARQRRGLTWRGAAAATAVALAYALGLYLLAGNIASPGGGMGGSGASHLLLPFVLGVPLSRPHLRCASPIPTAR